MSEMVLHKAPPVQDSTILKLSPSIVSLSANSSTLLIKVIISVVFIHGLHVSRSLAREKLH